jgi:hypothetical protein
MWVFKLIFPEYMLLNLLLGQGILFTVQPGVDLSLEDTPLSIW